jgi:hypothetical protein
MAGAGPDLYRPVTRRSACGKRFKRARYCRYGTERPGANGASKRHFEFEPSENGECADTLTYPCMFLDQRFSEPLAFRATDCNTTLAR